MVLKISLIVVKQKVVVVVVQIIDVVEMKMVVEEVEMEVVKYHCCYHLLFLVYRSILVFSERIVKSWWSRSFFHKVTHYIFFINIKFS